MTTLLRPIACLAILMTAFAAQVCQAQTPSPLQEWQYSGGVILARLFEPDLPQWRVVGGVAADVAPIYDGARASQVGGGPVINVYYRDIAYFSTGEGLGYNFLRGDQYQVGVGLAYDLGRKDKDDGPNLNGMGNIGAAPVAKIYGSVGAVEKVSADPARLRPTVHRRRTRSCGGRVGVYPAPRQFEDLRHVRRSVNHCCDPSLFTNALRRHCRTIGGLRSPVIPDFQGRDERCGASASARRSFWANTG